jgi:hypothetical protein
VATKHRERAVRRSPPPLGIKWATSIRPMTEYAANLGEVTLVMSDFQY